MSKDSVLDRQSKVSEEITYFFEDFPNDDKLTSLRYPDANGACPTFSNQDEKNTIYNIRDYLERSQTVLNSGKQLSNQTLTETEEVINTAIRNYRTAVAFIESLKFKFLNGFDAGSVHEPELITEKKQVIKGLNDSNYKLEIIIPKLEALYIPQQIARIQDSLSDKGLSKFSSQYREICQEHKTTSRVWLFLGFVLAFSIAAMCFRMAIIYGPNLLGENMSKLGKDSGDSELGPHIYKLVTILFFTFLYISMPMYMMVACFKNFKINKHNQLSNKQKELSLETYSTFIASAEGDREIKRLIVEKATSLIFSNTEHGYLGSENDYKSPSILPIQHLHSALKEHTK